MFIDTHAHLDFPEFKEEATAVLMRAKEVGVGKIINVGVDVASSKKSWELARKHPEIYATVGLHPHSAADLNIETQGDLIYIAQQDKVVAVGEIGLDYYFIDKSSKYSNYPGKKQQQFCFEQMLDFALDHQLPVIVHNREADADIYSLLKSYNGLRGVVHCFSSDYAFAKKIIDLGLNISFTGNITFKNNVLAEEVIKKIPLCNIMIETDSPYLSPEPHRGKRNEPAFVVEVAKKIAAIRGISMAEVEMETTKKARKLFGI